MSQFPQPGITCRQRNDGGQCGCPWSQCVARQGVGEALSEPESLGHDQVAPRRLRMTAAEYAAKQPPAPCGHHESHYEWEHLQGMRCPHCCGIELRRRRAVEQEALAGAAAEQTGGGNHG